MKLFNFFSSKPARGLKRRAFTVGELTTATTVLGLISVITLGVLVHSIDEKKQAVAKTILNNEIAISLAEMYADENLSNLDLNTFKANFEKYFPVKEQINEVNASKYLAGEEGENLYQNEKGEELLIKDPTNGNYVNPKSLPYQFVSDKGVTVLIGYNKENLANTNLKYIADKGGKSLSAEQSYEAKNQALGSIYGIYDVNGSEGPNQLGKDIGIFGEAKGSEIIGGSLSDADKITKDPMCKTNPMNCSVNEFGDVQCSISNSYCAQDNKVLDKKNCVCIDRPGNDETKNTCMSKIDDLFAPTKCRENGGIWTDDCKCLCGYPTDNPSIGSDDSTNSNNSNIDLKKLEANQATAAYRCESSTNKFAYASSANYCACQCKSLKAIEAVAAQNAYENTKNAETRDYQKYWINEGGINLDNDCLDCKKIYTTQSSMEIEVKEVNNQYCIGACPTRDVQKCNNDKKSKPTLSLRSFDAKTQPCQCLCDTGLPNSNPDTPANIAKNNLEHYQTLLDNALKVELEKAGYSGFMSTPIFKNLSKAEEADYYIRKANESRGCSNCSGCSSDSTWRGEYREIYKNYKGKTFGTGYFSGNTPSLPMVFNTTSCAYEYGPNKGNRLIPRLADKCTTIYFHGCAGLAKAVKICVKGYEKELSINFNPNAHLLNNNDLFTENYLFQNDESNPWSNSYWGRPHYATSYHVSIDEWWDPVIIAPYEEKSYRPHANAKAVFKYNPKEPAQKITWLDWSDSKAKQYLLVKNKGVGHTYTIEDLFADVLENPKKQNGEVYNNGLEQLQTEYDKNNDGLVNDADGIMNQLALWGDKSEDAKVDTDELIQNVGLNSQNYDWVRIMEFNTNATTNQNSTGDPAVDPNVTYTISGQYTIVKQSDSPPNLGHNDWYKFEGYENARYNNTDLVVRKYVKQTGYNPTNEVYYLVPNWNNDKQQGQYNYKWFKKFESWGGPMGNYNNNNNNVLKLDSINYVPWNIENRMYHVIDGNHYKEIKKGSNNLFDVRFRTITDEEEVKE